MELQEEIIISAERDQVFAALNDIAILQACIPGCEELVWDGENQLAAKVTLKIGPVKARFSGKVTLDPSKAPDAFSLAGEGDGGVAGLQKVARMSNCLQMVTKQSCDTTQKLKPAEN